MTEEKVVWEFLSNFQEASANLCCGKLMGLADYLKKYRLYSCTTAGKYLDRHFASYKTQVPREAAGLSAANIHIAGKGRAYLLIPEYLFVMV